LTSDPTNAVDFVDIHIEGANITLKKKDFHCLRPKAWLSDEIINSFTSLINTRNARYMEEEGRNQDTSRGEPTSHDSSNIAAMFDRPRCPTYIYPLQFMSLLLLDNTDGYDFSKVKRWHNKRCPYSILELGLIMFPAWVDQNHFVLVILDTITKQIVYFDSADGRREDIVEAVLRWYPENVKDKTGDTVVMEDYGIVWNPVYCPLQSDGSSCGISFYLWLNIWSL